jgi:hypothetical protein
VALHVQGHALYGVKDHPHGAWPFLSPFNAALDQTRRPRRRAIIRRMMSAALAQLPLGPTSLLI